MDDRVPLRVGVYSVTCDVPLQEEHGDAVSEREAGDDFDHGNLPAERVRFSIARSLKIRRRRAAITA
jgi:hypothetical protein